MTGPVDLASMSAPARDAECLVAVEVGIDADGRLDAYVTTACAIGAVSGSCEERAAAMLELRSGLDQR